MSFCVNINSNEFKSLLKETGLDSFSLELKIKSWQINNSINDFPTVNDLENMNNIFYSFKSSKIIYNNLDKIKIWGKNKSISQNELYDKIQKLGIPKEQLELLKNSNGNTIEEKLINLLANYSYTVEINTAKEKPKTEYGTSYYIKDGYFYQKNDEGFFKQLEGRDNPLIEISKEEYEENQGSNTQYYSNLTVPGGTNYTEQEIATPGITPSIKGHAQFATDNGIGWFRSDEKLSKESLEEHLEEEEYQASTNLNHIKGSVRFENAEGSKTRRILEVQSDLFQKGRDKELLVESKTQNKSGVGSIPYTTTGKYAGLLDRIRNKANEVLGKTSSERPDGQTIELEGNTYYTMNGMWYLKEKEFTNENQFLQLLNKNNNWVTFFVKSIIQDSAKKGYEKVLFPTGNTASKVEGHTTLEEFKKQKEDRIKEIENTTFEKTYKIATLNEDAHTGGEYKTKEEAEAFLNNLSDNIKNDYKVVLSEPFRDKENLEGEKAQLKQELERVEREGFGALKPIYNFYENTVINILKKQGYSPKLITDEYGNTWNEVTLNSKNLEPVLFQETSVVDKIKRIAKLFNINDSGFFNKSINVFQLKSKLKDLGIDVAETKNKNGYYLTKDGKLYNPFYQETPKGLKKIDPKKEAEITSKIKNFLQKIGVTTINVEAITDVDGNPINAVGVAKLLSKIIEVVENKADVTTLAEEAAHFFTLMLKDNAFFEKMILDIDQYPVYKEVTESKFYKDKYKNNERLLRIEAVGKQIVKSILKQESIESEKLDNKFKRFWNNILNKLKSLFSRASAQDKKSIFDIAAEDILKGDISKIDVNKKIDLELYQEDDKQSEIINNLDNKFNVSYNENLTNSKTGKKGVYELSTPEGLKKIENRVSDDVEAINKKRGFTERTSVEKAQDEVGRTVGVAGHADINNIITRIVEGISGVETTAKVTSLDDTSYNVLENYFKDFIKEFPAGSKFYTEKIIYDENRDQAGTIDLLVILPNGKAEIYDWKFVEFKQKDSSGKIINKSVAWYKEENYNVQLTRYRQILRHNYGISEFGKTRVIPIKAEYKKNKLQSIEIGNTKIDNIDKTYLDPISISGLAGGEVEFTDDAKINAMLETLLQQRKRILDKSESTAEGKIKKSERLERINNSIKKLQIEGDIKSFLDDAVFELNYIVNVGIENLNNDDLVKAKELVDYYSDLLKDGKLPDDQKTSYTQILSRVVLNSQDLYSKINEEYEKRIKDTAMQVGVTNPFELQPESGLLARLFRSISQNNHPLIKTFYKTLTKQRDKVYYDTKKLNSQISEKVENLKKWGETKGLKDFDLYKDLLQYDKDGNWTGKLINQWDSEYYRLKNLALANKDFDWIGENCTFDSEKYQKYFEKNKTIWEQMYKGDVDGEIKLKRRIEEFEMKFNAAKHNTAILNKSNRFIHPKEVWRSKEWKKLQNPENKPLKEFYELFKNTIDEFREYLPIDLEGNFIPNIKNDLMDQIIQSGLDSISGLGESIIQHLESGSDETVGMIDEITGEKIKTVPLLYTNKLDSKSKSKDLGKVLSLFGNMAYNYKYMSEIESSSNMLKDLLGSQKQLITTANGKKLKSKVTGELASAIGNSETLEQLNDYINYYIYGIKTKGKDAVFKIGDKELSGQKTFSKTLMYYSTKSLSLNLLSGLANGLGGTSNAFFEGIKGRFYSNSEFSKSLAMLSSKNNMAYSAMEFWDIDSTNNDFKKSNKLSISKVTKNMTMDKFFILQHGGDFVIENGVLLSMLQSHTLKDGKIVKKSKEEKSLLELSSNSKDFKLDNLTDEEYQKFRRKVKYIYSTIKGNTNPEDINSIKMTVLGQAVMQFRGWIPRMADERFGELRYTEDLETYEMGKYRSFWNQTINKQILPNIFTALAQGGVLGIGANSINSKSVTQKAIQLYNEAKYKNPDLKITQTEFIELHKQNLRSTALELQIILAITLLLVGLKGMDDDDDKDSVRRVAMKILQRNLAEISFFADPDSTTSILKKPIPILSFASDITGFVSDLTGEAVGYITNDEKRIEKNKPARKFNKIFPVTNALENFWALADPDYNR